MKRLFDIVVGFVVLGIASFPMVAVAIAVRLSSRGPILHWSDRVGRDNRTFRMPKFRTMVTDAPQVATHLLGDREAWLTPIGGFLRRTSLDELPQIWSILRGHMRFVGPRPALYNQHDLIRIRTKLGVHQLAPGLTGWAQINGRDELPVHKKAELDAYYARHASFWFDLKILVLTVWKVFTGDGTTVPDEVVEAESAMSVVTALAESAKCWFESGDFDAAIREYDQAISVEPDDADLFNERGKAKLAKGDASTAIADFDQALRLDPEFAEAYHNRGNAFVELREFQQATRDHSQAAALDDQYSVIHLAVTPRDRAAEGIASPPTALIEQPEKTM